MKTGKILDPIHGTIGITEIEKFVINQKIFGRLRKVKQNTLLNYVFPGANHTRFEHSIGVMHLSEEIFNKSNENVNITELKNEKYNIEKKYSTIHELIDDDFQSRVTLQELRLSALLHDIGHGPTSHKFDDFTITGNTLLSILKSEKSIFSDYTTYFENYIRKNKLIEKRIEHELVSCVFIIKIINDLKAYEYLTEDSIKIRENIDVKNIIKMIEPSFLPDHEIEYNNNILTNYFNSIISSFPFDADRMDYLFRDSFYSGVKYGFFDLSRILMSILPVKDGNQYTLGIKESGMGSIIRFIQSRNHLYNQVYFHKTNCATNTMLDFVFRHMKGQSVISGIKNYQDYESFYCDNSDEHFFKDTLKSILIENGCDICTDGCIENDVLDELINRNLWKRIYEERIIVNDTKNIDSHKFDENKIRQLRENLEKEGTYILENYSTNKGLKGFEKSKIVIISKKNGVVSNWKDFDDEFKFLNQTNLFIKRIYLRKTFNDAQEYKDIKDSVLDKLKNIINK
ncbi:HD domain-containing protein [Tenacibaculum finnmarkense]|uniref:HD domain-containing protein n=1 Tax=Tenacibaculum finnmarkense TaxID=2781243 RepID=UPI001E5B5F01|nr:HD domain-containing protein [Tenacibaculum finnmarkense]MCD8413717.1 HD domain-containing protein [Tenacibaculum finnmarkense genomovar ulcerans]